MHRRGDGAARGIADGCGDIAFGIHLYDGGPRGGAAPGSSGGDILGREFGQQRCNGNPPGRWSGIIQARAVGEIVIIIVERRQAVGSARSWVCDCRVSGLTAPCNDRIVGIHRTAGSRIIDGPQPDGACYGSIPGVEARGGLGQNDSIRRILRIDNEGIILDAGSIGKISLGILQRNRATISLR